jgi:hypothetical protein
VGELPRKSARSPRSPRLVRVARLAIIALTTLLLLWLVGGYLVFVHPRVDKPVRVDAILVLGPPDSNGRLDEALALARQHIADTLVVSVEPDGTISDYPVCAGGDPALTVICFQPSNPPTTRGEARELARLSAQHGWKSVLVVTSSYHVSRARLIIKRCFTGRLLMVAARRGLGLSAWPYHYAYESASYAKAFLQNGC